MINIHSQWTPDDLIAAQRLHFKAVGWARLLPILLMIVAILNVFYVMVLAFAFGPNLLWNLLSLLFLLSAYPVIKYVLYPRQIRRAYRQSDLYSSPQDIEFDESAIQFNTNVGYTKRQWTDYLKWKTDGQCILLYHTDMLYTPLPAHFFDDSQQFDFVLTQLRAHQVPAAKTPRQLIFINIFMIVLLTGLLLMLAL